MNRQIKVYIGGAQKRVRTLFFNASGNHENSGFEYSPEWIEQENSFEIDPSLPLGHGRVFRAKKGERSAFHGAIADSEPDGWAKQVTCAIMAFCT